MKPDLKKMRAAGALVRRTFEYLEGHFIRAGITTGQLDKLAHDHIVSNGGWPAPLGYTMDGAPPFPKSICTSINEIAAHGVPRNDELLSDGDLISIDISLSIDGHFGDACRTYCIGAVSYELESFVKKIQSIHDRLITFVSDNVGYCTTADVGAYTEQLAGFLGIDIAQGFGGHGIGRSLHCAPFVPPSSIQGQGTLLESGMFITIEPIFTMAPTSFRVAPDGWSVFAPSGTRSGQVEHTLYLGPNGVEILT